MWFRGANRGEIIVERTVAGQLGEQLKALILQGSAQSAQFCS